MLMPGTMPRFCAAPLATSTSGRWLAVLTTEGTSRMPARAKMRSGRSGKCRQVQSMAVVHSYFVIPAKAGIQRLLYERHWIPAFAGMTIVSDPHSADPSQARDSPHPPATTPDSKSSPEAHPRDIVD